METSSKLQNQNDINLSSANAPISFRERMKLILKFAFVAFIFWFLFKKGLVTANSFHRVLANPTTLVLCLFLMLLNTVIGAVRWQVLLKIQSIDFSFQRVLQLNLIGAFFNIALPGAVSGDFVKAVYAVKKFKDKSSEVFGSIFFDRILGVSAMVFVAGVSAIISLFINWGGSLPFVLLSSVGAVGLAIGLFFAYMFLSHSKDPLFAVVQFVTKRHTKLAIIDRLYLGVMSYRKDPLRILKAISIALIIHLLLILIAFFITEAIAPAPIPIVALAILVPIGLLATSIPVLPAGVGTGHAAFYALFKLVGSDLGAEVFSWIVLFQVLVGIWGGVMYLKHKND